MDITPDHHGIDEVAIKLISSCVATVFGQTGCGKTELCYRIMRHADKIFDKKISGIMYAYQTHQSLFDKMQATIPNIVFTQGIPSREDIDNLTKHDPEGHHLLFLDDLQSKIMNSPEVIDLVCVDSHHRNISVFLILQNLYSSGKFARTVSLQSHYLFCLKSLRDRTQLCTLATQIYGKSKSGIIAEALQHQMSLHTYPYVLVDISPHSERKTAVRSNIFPTEYMHIYVPK